MLNLHRCVLGTPVAMLISAPAAAYPIKLDLAIAIGGATPASLAAWSEAANADAAGSIEIVDRAGRLNSFGSNGSRET